MSVRMDSAARVQPIRFGDMAQPGTCLLCNRIGHNPNELFATLNVELEFYGVAYLCQECCKEVASFVLYKSPDAFLHLKEKYDILLKDYDIMRHQLAEAKGLVNARIDSAGSGEPYLDDTAGVPVSKAQSISVDVDRILDDHESESVKSGKG